MKHFLLSVGEKVIIHIGYNDFEGEVKEITENNITLTLDKKKEAIIDKEKIYAITYLK